MSKISVSDLVIYPIKSTAGVHLQTGEMLQRGLAHDRRFVVATLDGLFLSARTQTKLLSVRSRLIDGGVQIAVPNLPDLDLHYQSFAEDYRALEVWGRRMQAQYCSAQADNWFSKLLGRKVQLLFCGEQNDRFNAVAEDFEDKLYRGEQGIFADSNPMMVISEASLKDLNARLEEKITMDRFRPNLVVAGGEPYQEDHWQRIRVGEVEFKSTWRCSRCILINVDPLTYQSSKRGQPLKTLSSYRKADDGKTYLGQNMIALNNGTISLGDEVEVLETKTVEQ